MTAKAAGVQERIDAQALALRESGKAFATIAQLLDLRGAQHAHDCFVRAVRRHPPARQRRLRNDELVRLRDLEVKVRDNANLSPFDRELQLDIVRTLRSRLLAP